MTDLVTNYLTEEREKTKYLVDSVVEMEINYLFTNDYDYLNNFTTFIPKQQRPPMNNANNQAPGQGAGQGQNQGNNQMNNNDMRPQPPIDAKNRYFRRFISKKKF